MELSNLIFDPLFKAQDRMLITKLYISFLIAPRHLLYYTMFHLRIRLVELMLFLV